MRPSPFESAGPTDSIGATMTRFKFIKRLYQFIGLMAVIQIAAMYFIAFSLTRPSLAEVKIMLAQPSYLILGLFSSFLVIAYIYLLPLMRFIDDHNKGAEISGERVEAIQAKCLNFPYVLASLGLPYYFIGGLITGHQFTVVLEWSNDVSLYFALAGALSCFWVAPLVIYSYHYVARPVMELARDHSANLPPARPAGWRVSVRAKLVINVLCLVAGIAGSISIIGYKHSRMMLEDQAALEQRLDAARSLAESAKGPGEAPADLATVAALGGEGGFTKLHGIGPGALASIYITLMLASIAICLVIIALTSREITDAVAELKQVAERVTAGEHEEPIHLVTNDEFADLGAAVNTMMSTIIRHLARIESILESLKGGVDRTDDAVSSMVEVSMSQSAGAAEQAAVVHESSTIAQEIVSAAGQISERSMLVSQSASDTLAACDDGDVKLAQARNSFNEIAEQTGRIRTSMTDLEARVAKAFAIIELIGEIADQTELLALNASLEAAGAGEHGHRFGVVAESTGQLAQRTLEANEDIRALLETIGDSTRESVKSIERGMEKVEEGGQAIREVAEAFERISRLAGSTTSTSQEISFSSQQQTAALDQLSESIDRVREVAEKVEDGSGQIEKTVRELKVFSNSMRQSFLARGGVN